MDLIEMNFRKAKEQAAQLEELAARLDNLAKKDIQETMQNLSGAGKVTAQMLIYKRETDWKKT